MKLPKGISHQISRNEHKIYYQSMEDYINDRKDLHLTKEEKEACIETDTIWEMTWYPNTPVVGKTTGAPTLEALLEKTNYEK